MIRRLLTLIAVLAAAGTAHTRDLRFHHIGLEQNLPGPWARAFAQDRNGFIWIGTDSGLARFDGYEVLSFKHDDENPGSLPSNAVRELHVDQLGQLWVGTENRGLSRYNPEQRTFTQIDFIDYDPNWIQALAESDGVLYIGTDDGLFELSLEEQSARLVPLSLQFRVRSLAVDGYNNIWIGTRRKGLFRYRKDGGGELRQFGFGSNNQSPIRALAVDELNTLWIAVGRQLFSLASGIPYPQQWLSNRIPPSPIASIKSLKSGQIAIGTLDGLQLLQPDTSGLLTYRENSSFSDSLRDRQVYEVFEDQSGSLWVGTYNGGAHYTNPDMLKLGLNRGSVNCPLNNAEDIKRDNQQRVWVARRGGVVRIEPDGQCTIIRLAESVDDSLNYDRLFFDSGEQLWVQLEGGGLARFDASTDRFNLVNLPALEAVTVADIFESAPDRFWLGTERQGLFLFNPIHTTLETVGRMQEMTIHEIHRYQDGILLATDRGALLYRPETELVSRPFEMSDRISVQTLLVDQRRQAVWLGTANDGLFRADFRTGDTVRVGEDMAFSGEAIHNMLIDNAGTLWVTNNQGLFQLPINHPAFRHLQSRDGLQGNAFQEASYNASEDLLLLAGINGINIFKTTDVPFNESAPVVVFTRFAHPNDRTDTQLASMLHSVELNHQSKDFNFEMAALNFDDPQRNQYAYKLDNYNEDWIYTDAAHRQASYTNLPAGTYTLRAKAANKDGVWSSSDTELEIIIKPAPWLTWWAKLTYLLAGITILYSLHSWRHRAAVQRADELQTEVRRRTLEIAQQKATIEGLLERKNDLFAAISHEFRTPLTLLLGPLNSLSNEVSGTAQKNVELARRNSLRLLTLVDQLLAMAKTVTQQETVRKPQQLSAHLLGLVELFNAAAELKEITIQLNTPPSDLHVLIEDGALELVLGNLLSNAIKYSPPGSTINIAANWSDDSVVIHIADQGTGISEQEQAAVFERFYRTASAGETQGTGLGLAVARETAQANLGDISLKSVPGEGSIFSVQLQRATGSGTQAADTSHANVLESQLDLLKISPPEKAKPELFEPDSQVENPLVLIIEDNTEMRSFIRDSLSTLYHFAEAANGAEGIAEAIRLVPDVIICDIMMPEKDGFEVTRTLRQDSRTSHIPIVMLTARTDQESRIRGWRESVDEYLCKPFSAEELQARINSILVVRQILQRRFSSTISNQAARQQLSATLPKSDQDFLDKLEVCLDKNYADPDFGATQIGSAVAMSNRQLQRKLKALVDYAPSDYLREFRLKKAADMLIQGRPVGLVSDDCGFSSPNQFSRCFKARFGMTPKKYQQSSAKA